MDQNWSNWVKRGQNRKLFIKKRFLLRGQEMVEIIPFPVWRIPFPVLKNKFEPFGSNEKLFGKEVF